MKPRATVSGEPEGGYVVDLHDGERHAVFTVQADSMDAALTKGMEQWDADAPEAEPSPQVQGLPATELPSTAGLPDAPETVATPLPSHEPEHAEHPSLPVEPGDNLVAHDDAATPGEKVEMAEDRKEMEGDHSKHIGGTMEPAKGDTVDEPAPPAAEPAPPPAEPASEPAPEPAA